MTWAASTTESRALLDDGAGAAGLPLERRGHEDRAMADGWRRRAELGEELAAEVGDPRTDERLVALLLDPDDTAVTYRTAVALLERRDPRAVRLVVRAGARADSQHLDWIADAFHTLRASRLGEDDPFLRASLAAAQDDDDPRVAQAARDWARSLGLE